MVFSFLYTVVEKGLMGDLTVYPATNNTYSYKTSMIVVPIMGLFTGLVMGAFEVIYLSKKFKTKSFGFKLFTKSLIYVLSICLFLFALTFVANSIAMGMSPFHPEVLQSISNFLITSFVFWSVVIYIGVMITITIFISDVSDNLGQGVLVNFLTGKYNKPRVEERIFMFLDMKSSTSIAEKLGHVKYYELLNDYYADLTGPILETAGRIYQYVGDEVVVRWNMEDGLKDRACIRCFFMMKDIFQKKEEYYLEKYGFVPGFKAGYHYGRVTMGEIGIVKKDIIFTGDVLNTTSRIQGLCNSYQVDLLISENLIDLLNIDKKLQLREMGVSELRGREETIKLYTLAQSS